MNVFEIISDTIFIEDEYDLNFIMQNAEKLGVKKEDIKLNTIINLNKEQKEYIVKPLDTFESVSKKLGVDVEILKQKVESGRLFVGQKIILKWQITNANDEWLASLWLGIIVLLLQQMTNDELKKNILNLLFVFFEFSIFLNAET